MTGLQKGVCCLAAAGMALLAGGCFGRQAEKDTRLQVTDPQGELVATLEDSQDAQALAAGLLEAPPAEDAPALGTLLGTVVVEQPETLKAGQDPDDRGWVAIARIQVGEEACRVELLPAREGESLLSWTVRPTREEMEALEALWGTGD